MKIMKKIAAVTIAAAALFAFAGCSDADDPNEMITGSNKNYEIDYTNTTEETSRGYHSTAYKHAGAAVQLDFLNVNKDTKEAGVMGLIFDLEEKDGVKSFNVIGVRTADTEGGLGYYVSRFENVKDIQDENFGAWKKTDENGNVIAGSSDGEETPATQASGAPTYQESDGTFAEDADGNRYYTDKKGNITYNVDSYNYVDSNGEIITDGYGYIDPYTGAYIQ